MASGSASCLAAATSNTLPNGRALNDTTGYLARYTIWSCGPYDGHLASTDGSYNNTDFITDTGPTSATKILNNLPIANYYIAMTTGWGCSWSVTFSPR